MQLDFVIKTSAYNDTPINILVPKLGKEKYPTMIYLQGHSPGANTSLGIEKGVAGLEELVL